MIRCCMHCGALLEDDAKVCSFCGAALEVTKADLVTQEIPVETPADDTSPPSKKKLSKKTLFITGGVLLGVIVLAVAVYFLFFGSHYAVHKFESVINGNFKQIKQLAPMEYWEQKAAEKEMSVSKYIDTQIERLKKSEEENRESRKETYGDNFYRSVTVVDSEQLTDDVFSGIKNALQEQYDIASSRVKSAQTLIVKTVVKGSKHAITAVYILTAVQIDFQWYLIRYQIKDDVYTVSFRASGSSADLLM